MTLNHPRILRLPFMLAAAAALLPVSAVFAATVEGRVLNAATGVYLNNARVVVEGSTLEAFTDGNGDFRINGVPAGQVRLRVTYAGLEPGTAAVLAAEGVPARRDFELDLPRERTTAGPGNVVRLANFIVESTQLSAQAAAINEQKVSPNIKNVVVLDEVGDLGDGNIGEYLKYTPGISIVSAPQTAGTASIRGLSLIHI